VRPSAVAEVSEQLGVSTATVYKLCKRAALPHVRIIDTIRVRPADLAGFLAAHNNARLVLPVRKM